MTKSENLVTATGPYTPSLPVLIYSTTFKTSQNCEMRSYQWYGVK